MLKRVNRMKSSLKPAFYSIPVDFEPGWGISVKFSIVGIFVTKII